MEAAPDDLRSQLRKLADKMADLVEERERVLAKSAKGEAIFDDFETSPETISENYAGLLAIELMQLAYALKDPLRDFFVPRSQPDDDPSSTNRQFIGDLSDDERTHNGRVIYRSFLLLEPCLRDALIDRDDSALARHDLSNWGRPLALPRQRELGRGKSASASIRRENRRRVYELATYEAGRDPNNPCVMRKQRELFGEGTFSEDYWYASIRKPLFESIRTSPGNFFGEPDETFWVSKGKGKVHPHPDLKYAKALARAAKG